MCGFRDSTWPTRVYKRLPKVPACVGLRTRTSLRAAKKGGKHVSKAHRKSTGVSTMPAGFQALLGSRSAEKKKKMQEACLKVTTTKEFQIYPQGRFGMMDMPYGTSAPVIDALLQRALKLLAPVPGCCAAPRSVQAHPRTGTRECGEVAEDISCQSLDAFWSRLTSASSCAMR